MVTICVAALGDIRGKEFITICHIVTAQPKKMILELHNFLLSFPVNVKSTLCMASRVGKKKSHHEMSTANLMSAGDFCQMKVKSPQAVGKTWYFRNNTAKRHNRTKLGRKDKHISSERLYVDLT